MIDAVLGFLESVLTFLHDIFVPVFGLHSWGWAIIALTLIVRVALLPLAIKQTRSMRAMQAVQPQMKEIQKKHKVDRELMRKDPEAYRAKKAKLNEEMMALYQREGVNPAASCLPLLAQAPIFLALFWTLQRSDDLAGAPFYFFTGFVDAASASTGLAAVVSDAGWPGWLLIVLMSGTMFLSQKQMMARNAAQLADSPMAQQQKILLYVMPVFLAVISFRFPLGILLYWVTTNLWQVVQQWIILREVQHEVETGEIASKPGGEAAKRTDGGTPRKPRKPSPGASTGKRPADTDDPADGRATDAGAGPREPDAQSTPHEDGSSKGSRTNGSAADGDGKRKDGEAAPKGSSGHLPRRRRRDQA